MQDTVSSSERSSPWYSTADGQLVMPRIGRHTCRSRWGGGVWIKRMHARSLKRISTAARSFSLFSRFQTARRREVSERSDFGYEARRGFGKPNRSELQFSPSFCAHSPHPWHPSPHSASATHYSSVSRVGGGSEHYRQWVDRCGTRIFSPPP